VHPEVGFVRPVAAHDLHDATRDKVMGDVLRIPAAPGVPQVEHLMRHGLVTGLNHPGQYVRHWPAEAGKLTGHDPERRGCEDVDAGDRRDADAHDEGELPAD